MFIRTILSGLLLFTLSFFFSFVPAEAGNQASTETNCNFGMSKGQASGSCHVPIPSGCTVSKIPGIDQRWIDISKGGGTTCRFDDEHSDWKKTIVGTCDECTTDHCSARFSVKFDCTNTMTPPQMQRPER